LAPENHRKIPFFANRHRGESRLSSPATPPDKRVRIRRFGWIELFPNVQPWKSK
jgi:hypothetical protein